MRKTHCYDYWEMFILKSNDVESSFNEDYKDVLKNIIFAWSFEAINIL